MGRVLVADLPSEERSIFVKRAPLTKKTTHTITNRAELGKILDAVHTQGWALLDQELEEGVRSIAAPLRDKKSRTIAAINIGTQTGRVPLARLVDELLPQLIKTAKLISIDLGHR